MDKETLYMQKLAGIITESEYNKKLNEFDPRTPTLGQSPAPTGNEPDLALTRAMINFAKANGIEELKKRVEETIYRIETEGLD